MSTQINVCIELNMHAILNGQTYRTQGVGSTHLSYYHRLRGEDPPPTSPPVATSICITMLEKTSELKANSKLGTPTPDDHTSSISAYADTNVVIMFSSPAMHSIPLKEEARIWDRVGRC